MREKITFKNASAKLKFNRATLVSLVVRYRNLFLNYPIDYELRERNDMIELNIRKFYQTLQIFKHVKRIVLPLLEGKEEACRIFDKTKIDSIKRR